MNSEYKINLAQELKNITRFFVVMFEYPTQNSVDFFLKQNDFIRELCELTRTELVSFKNLNLLELETNYNSLFIVEPSKNGAVLYESFYTSDSKLLNQESERKLLELIQTENGFVAPNCPSDYLPVILEFINHLSDKFITTKCDEDFDRIQFVVGNHILNWIEKFTFDILKNSNVFYGFVANLFYNYFKMLSKNFEEIKNYNFTDFNN
ncbi:MAG: hypothetical protein DWQ06_13465 [Calditrichaeota bacterium]|nr:MAG: hypothetical protein DWQ06_13465 [Calditrichota bacterium]